MATAAGLPVAAVVIDGSGLLAGLRVAVVANVLVAIEEQWILMVAVDLNARDGGRRPDGLVDLQG